jgi:hypothetical protein
LARRGAAQPGKYGVKAADRPEAAVHGDINDLEAGGGEQALRVGHPLLGDVPYKQKWNHGWTQIDTDNQRVMNFFSLTF